MPAGRRRQVEFARLRPRQHKVRFAKQMGHHPLNPEHLALTRREFLSRCGMGMGALGLAGLMGSITGRAAASEGFTSPLMPKSPHFPGTAKRVIHIFANGGASQVDTFDPKPMLDK